MTLYQLAHRFVGEIQERPGEADHPWIQWALSLCGMGFDAHDEVAWCSAAVNAWAWELRLPRSKSAAARSWLGVGQAIPLQDARAENDIVILMRGAGLQPDASVLAAPGHVIVFAGLEGDFVRGIGGNQGNGVSIAQFPIGHILGIRRLA